MQSRISIAEDIELARRAGVQNFENLPFLRQPQNPAQHAVLLVHGFTATPREMLPLGDYLASLDFTALGIRLPGHGTTPEDLARQRLEDWLMAVEQGYQLLAESHQSVSAVGLSTGAMLLLRLCVDLQYEKLVLLSPFLKLKHKLAPFAGFLRWLIPFHKRSIADKDLAFYYQRRPLSGIAQINRLTGQLAGNLNQLKCPCLILASRGDETVAPGTAGDIYSQLGSPLKQFHCYGPEVPHVLTTSVNPERDDVFMRIGKFLQKFPDSETFQTEKF